MKSNSAAKRALGLPHWVSNTQFRAKCKRTGKWVTKDTKSWSTYERRYLYLAPLLQQ